MNINEALARKVLEVVDAGLVEGVGVPEPGKMCIEAAVNYAMGDPHGDQPKCVAPSLRRLKIRLNDSSWSSPDARAKGLRRLGIAQLGSAGALDEVEFAKRVATLAIGTCVPQALRSAASICKDETRKANLIAHAEKCESEPTEANARSAKNAADAADAAAYAAAADAAAYATAAYADAYAAADYAAYAAVYAATAADYAAYAAVYAATAATAARDKSLADFAEGVVQILINMGAPGCEWLFLTEAA